MKIEKRRESVAEAGLAEKARKIVERKRRLIREGAALFMERGGKYSEEDQAVIRGWALESRRIAVEREELLKEAVKELNAVALGILYGEYFDAIREEGEKAREQMKEIIEKMNGGSGRQNKEE